MRNMIEAVVLVACEAGKYVSVASDIRKVKGVKESFPVFGRWDVVAKMEAKDLSSLSDVVLKVNGMRTVKATETLIGVVVK